MQKQDITPDVVACLIAEQFPQWADLPLPIPRPIAKGEPGSGFPAPWSIYGWLGGAPAAGAHSFHRGGPVSVWDEQTRETIDLLAEDIDAPRALAAWDSAMTAEWTGPDVWVHGDVTGSNLLMLDDRLSGVIDFGCSAVGDPACDLTPAWTLFDGSSRRRFVDAMGADEATWARASVT